MFEHLSKLAHEETSTEAASVHSSERDSDDHKHHIRIPTPFKDPKEAENSNLSNTVKTSSIKPTTEPLPLPKSTAEPLIPKVMSPTPSTSEIEEIQRQKMLNMITYNTILLNSVMSQQKICQKTLFDCIEGFKIIK